MRDAVTRAIDHYHALIRRDERASAGQLAELTAEQHRRGALFGGRPMAASLRPALIDEETYAELQAVAFTLRGALERLAGLILATPALLDELGLTDLERELAAIETPLLQASATTRLDAFRTADTFKLVEINAECPAGGTYCHEIAAIYRGLPLFREFEESFPLRFVSPLEHLVAGLLRAYHEEAGGREEKPSFAIVDFLDIPTYPEFLLIKAYLERHGLPCEIADPRALDCRDGWIFANGRRIDVLYRRLLTNEFAPIRREAAAFEAGYRAHRTCFINSFRSKLLHKKAIFALLTDPAFSAGLTEREREVVARHIPWTRRVREGRTDFGGRQVDLLPFLRDNRPGFVLKPNDEYGGRGVMIGFATGQAEWEAALGAGPAGDLVAQELVDIHREPFLLQRGGGFEQVENMVDLDPYLNGPLLGGCLARISATNLANVTAGGGSLPLFILRSPR